MKSSESKGPASRTSGRNKGFERVYLWHPRSTTAGPHRGWHFPRIQRILPTGDFSGIVRPAKMTRRKLSCPKRAGVLRSATWRMRAYCPITPWPKSWSLETVFHLEKLGVLVLLHTIAVNCPVLSPSLEGILLLSMDHKLDLTADL